MNLLELIEVLCNLSAIQWVLGRTDILLFILILDKRLAFYGDLICIYADRHNLISPV